VGRALYPDEALIKVLGGESRLSRSQPAKEFLKGACKNSSQNEEMMARRTIILDFLVHAFLA
jgi:hypothetical protein